MRCSCGGYIDEDNDSQPCCGECGSYGSEYDAVMDGRDDDYYDHYDNCDPGGYCYDFPEDDRDDGWSVFEPSF